MFEFRFGRMIFGWVMTLELVFLFKFEVIQTFSWPPLIYWLDIWYVATKNTSSMAITQPKVIRPERNSNLNCRSSRYSHRPNIKSIYQSLSSNFVPVEWYLAELWPLNLYFCSNFKLSRLFLDVLWYIDLIFGMWLSKKFLTFLTSLSLYIFTTWKCIAYNFFCRDGIYFDKILVSEYKLGLAP
jgi:hypothetical protein